MQVQMQTLKNIPYVKSTLESPDYYEGILKLPDFVESDVGVAIVNLETADPGHTSSSIGAPLNITNLSDDLIFSNAGEPHYIEKMTQDPDYNISMTGTEMVIGEDGRPKWIERVTLKPDYTQQEQNGDPFKGVTGPDEFQLKIGIEIRDTEMGEPIIDLETGTPGFVETASEKPKDYEEMNGESIIETERKEPDYIVPKISQEWVQRGGSADDYEMVTVLEEGSLVKEAIYSVTSLKESIHEFKKDGDYIRLERNGDYASTRSDQSPFIQEYSQTKSHIIVTRDGDYCKSSLGEEIFKEESNGDHIKLAVGPFTITAGQNGDYAVVEKGTAYTSSELKKSMDYIRRGSNGENNTYSNLPSHVASHGSPYTTSQYIK